MVAASIDALYGGSNGRYYTDWQVGRRVRTGEWRLCLRQRSPDRLLVETAGTGLLFLSRVEPEALPDWTEIRVDDRSARVVDTRGAVPSTARVCGRAGVARDEPGG